MIKKVYSIAGIYDRMVVFFECLFRSSVISLSNFTLFSLFAHCVGTSFGQVNNAVVWPTDIQVVNEFKKVSGSKTVNLQLGSTFPNGYNIETVNSFDEWPTAPKKGKIISLGKNGSWQATIEKYPFAEGLDSFVWSATDQYKLDKNFTKQFRITPSNDPLILYIQQETASDENGLTNSINMPEEQNFVTTLTLWDPDPEFRTYSDNDASEWPTLQILANDTDDDQFFDLVRSDSPPLQVNDDPNMNGWKQTYTINWKGSAPNFEDAQRHEFYINLEGNDTLAGTSQNWRVRINLDDVPEAPMPVTIDPPVGSQFLKNEISDRAFPANSQFNFTKDADYSLLEDTDVNISIPFKILSPDRDKEGIHTDIQIYFEAVRPFNVENNSSWASLEEISIQFLKPTQFKVDKIDSNGGITELSIIEMGFGYTANDFPLTLLSDDNGSGSGATINAELFNDLLSGRLLNIEIDTEGKNYKVGDLVSSILPNGSGFEILEEGVPSKFVPSLSEGEIKIRFPGQDAFLPMTVYKFYVQDVNGTIETYNEEPYPFFESEIEVVNDYSDQVSLFMSFPSPDNDGKELAHQRYFLENSNDIVADFNVTDPDSWPLADLRMDNNKSDQEGALIRYRLEWNADSNDPSAFNSGDPLNYFSITNDGLLSFLSPPDYDKLFPQNTYKLKVIVEDANSIDSIFHKRTFDFQDIDIIIENADEPNVFINTRYEPSSPPTYYIKLTEDDVWDWRMSSYDENGSQMRLVAKDLDYENTTEPSEDLYLTPEWTVLQEPLKGEVFVSPEIRDSDYSTRRWSIPKTLRYEASPNKIGKDEFSLDFGGSEPVRFVVEIENQPDKPVLTKIFTINGLGVEDDVDFNESSNEHYLYFNEDELAKYRFSFADEQDNDAIARLEVKKGTGDEKLFDVSDMDIGVDGHAFVEVSLREIMDFDQPSDQDLNNTYEITLIVEDNSSKSPPNNYNFIFVNQNVDEGPKINLPDLIVDEEQKIALQGLYAEDPEGEDKNFTWSVKPGEGNWTYFDVSVTQGKSIDLIFKDNKIPSYEVESERDLNVTLSVDDGRKRTETSFSIRLRNRNDPPFFETTEWKMSEPSKIAIQDLNDLITDEDRDFLTFFVNPNVPEPNDLKFFEPELVQGKTLLFKRPADYEEKSKYIVPIIAEDTFNFRTEGNITILVENKLEPPQVRWTGDEDQNFSFDDPLITFWHFEDLREDITYEINELFFYDPEESVPSPENLTFEIVNEFEGNLIVLESPTTDGSKPNGRFLYLPPKDGYTFSINPQNGEKVIHREPYKVEMRVTDTMDQSIIFTFQFSVEDEPDPPVILINPEIDNNVYSSVDPNDDSVIRNDEGSENVVILVADDSRDSSPSINYEWLQPYGPDGHLFKLIPLLENQKEVLLKWNLDEIGGKPPDWADPPVRIPGLPPPEFYEVKIRLFGNPADLNETGEDTAVRTLRINLTDLANQPPQFVSTSLPLYREGSPSRIAGRVEAYDPDEASLEILGEPKFQVHYELQESGAYPDYIWFNKDIFDKDDTSPVDYTGGQLVFKVAPDFEYFLSNGIGATLEVLVRAREYGINGYNDQETYQTIKIPLENNVEPPFFSPIVSEFNDANFSVPEESVGTFIIGAETPDYDKNLSISISQNHSLDNHLFYLTKLESLDEGTIKSNLSFLSPPDRESPRDYNKDNVYDVELNISTSDPAVWTLEKFKIKVEDLDYPYEISQEQIIQVKENQSFVLDIEVEDQENLYFFPDLLFSNEGGSFYASSSYSSNVDEPLFATQNINPLGKPLVASLSLSADFNNDGSADVLCISEGGAHIYQNEGYGTFSTSPLIDFSDLTATIALPKDAEIQDFDQDGDQDVILSYYSFNGDGNASVYLFENRLNEDGTVFSEGLSIGSGWKEPRSLQALDIDGDFDLDLVVADFAKNEVVWMLNDGDAGLSYGGLIASQLDGLEEPRCIESLDFNKVQRSLLTQPYNKPDLVIGAKGKLFIAENDGFGKFQVRSILDESINGYIRSVRAIKLDDDNLTDLVYIESGKGNAFFSLGHNNFSQTNPVISEKLNISISSPSSLEVYNFLNSEQNYQSLVLLGSSPVNSSMSQIHQIGPASRTDEGSGWEFVKHQPLTFNTGLIQGSIHSLRIADLDRAYNTYQFFIEDTLNFEEFDRTRIQSDGRLFFNPESIPDYENPLPGTENLYRLYVSYFKSGSDPLLDPPQSELFQIEIIDVNEAPVIKDFNGTVSGVFKHLENIQSVGEVMVDNPESISEVEQKLDFTIVPGNDSKFFDINRTSGELFFKKAPDRERPKDKAIYLEEDHIYQVEVEVKEQSIEGFSDRKTFLIEVIDGPENPIFNPQSLGQPESLNAAFGTKVLITLGTTEDLAGGKVILMEDLRLTDPNPNGAFTELFVFSEALHGDAFFLDDGNQTPLKEIEFLNSQTFSTEIRKVDLVYIPDANFSGFDEFTIQATSVAGIPAQLKVEMFVDPVNDPPVFFETITDTIFRNEGIRNVLSLKGVDSDSLDLGTLEFELINSLDSQWFAIDQNVVKFLDPRGLDYENQSRYEFELLLSSGSTFDRLQKTKKKIVLRVVNLADEKPISLPLQNSKDIKVYEGQRSILDLEIFDPDEFSPVQASILDGFDSQLFTITQLGELITVNPSGFLFDSKDPQKNIYELAIFLQDADMNNTYNVSVEVLDKDENPPVILTGISNAFHELSVSENEVFVYELIAEDIEKEVLEYTLESGLDANLFKLESGLTAKVSFKEAPNYEAPFPSLFSNGKYQIVLGVSDGLNKVEQLVTISVTDTNDPPILLNSTFNLLEDAISYSNFLNVSDDDNDSVTIEIVDSTLHGVISLQGNEFFYVPEANFFGSDKWVVSLNDGNNSSIHTITFLLESLNDPPVVEEDLAYFYNESRQSNQTIFIDVLSNDHTGPDSSHEKFSYEVEIDGSATAKGGTIELTGTNGLVEYSPPFDYLGEDSFEYRLIDQNFTSTGKVKVWVATSEKSPEWTRLLYFGTFYRETPNQNWIFHTDIGWVYLEQSKEVLNATWMWRENLGWFWTGDKYFKWLYHYELQQWLHWERGIDYTGGWFLRDANNEVYYEKDFIRLRVIKDVNEILPDLAGLSDYVQGSSFFSRQEVVNIILELNRYKRSSSLNEILEFDFSY